MTATVARKGSSVFKDSVIGAKAYLEFGAEDAAKILATIKSNPEILRQEGKTVIEVVKEVGAGLKIGRGSNFASQTRIQLLKSKTSHELLIREHTEKLAAYMKDPDKYDNLGILKNVSKEVKQKIIQGRIKELNRQIQRQCNDLDMINKLLKSKE